MKHVTYFFENPGDLSRAVVVLRVGRRGDCLVPGNAETLRFALEINPDFGNLLLALHRAGGEEPCHPVTVRWGYQDLTLDVELREALVEVLEDFNLRAEWGLIGGDTQLH